MQAFIVKLLSFLPGVLSSEVNMAVLLEVITHAEFSSPGITSAVVAIEKNADKVFVRDDWFKALALDVLSHVASIPAVAEPAPVPTVKS